MSNQKNAIPLDTAITWTSQWRAVESTYNKHNECNGFLVPAEDLVNVLKELQNQTGDKKVRMYLGVNPTTNEEKLLIVGTVPETQPDGAIVYRDIINGKVDGATVKGSIDSGIYDFTTACPPDCDKKSPLN